MATSLKALFDNRKINKRAYNYCKKFEIIYIDDLIIHFKEKAYLLSLPDCSAHTNLSLINLLILLGYQKTICSLINSANTKGNISLGNNPQKKSTSNFSEILLKKDNTYDIHNLDLVFLSSRKILSARSLNNCKTAGLHTLGDLISYYNKNKGFLSIPNCGEKSQNEILNFILSFSQRRKEIQEYFLNIPEIIYLSNNINKELVSGQNDKVQYLKWVLKNIFQVRIKRIKKCETLLVPSQTGAFLEGIDTYNENIIQIVNNLNDLYRNRDRDNIQIKYANILMYSKSNIPSYKIISSNLLEDHLASFSHLQLESKTTRFIAKNHLFIKDNPKFTEYDIAQKFKIQGADIYRIRQQIIKRYKTYISSVITNDILFNNITPNNFYIIDSDFRKKHYNDSTLSNWSIAFTLKEHLNYSSKSTHYYLVNILGKKLWFTENKYPVEARYFVIDESYISEKYFLKAMAHVKKIHDSNIFQKNIKSKMTVFNFENIQIDLSNSEINDNSVSFKNTLVLLSKLLAKYQKDLKL